jgi:sigma-B regulation protein RsbU (phosphoserine phosphatase)
VTYINAGHMPPIHLRPQNPDRISLLPSSGLPLGIDGDMRYETRQLILKPGEALIMYTDGVTDAFNPEGESFGMDRLKEMVASFPNMSAEVMLNTIENSVLAHIRNAVPFDDITIVIIKRLLVN